MSKKVTKSICVPIDGSEYAKRSLNYLHQMFGSDHPLKVILLYILPTLPPILVEEQKKDRSVTRKLKAVNAKHVEVAEKYLAEAKAVLLEKGFRENMIKTVYLHKHVGVAKDVCTFSDKSEIS